MAAIGVAIRGSVRPVRVRPLPERRGRSVTGCRLDDARGAWAAAEGAVFSQEQRFTSAGFRSSTAGTVPQSSDSGDLDNDPYRLFRCRTIMNCAEARGQRCTAGGPASALGAACQGPGGSPGAAREPATHRSSPRDRRDPLRLRPGLQAHRRRGQRATRLRAGASQGQGALPLSASCCATSAASTPARVARPFRLRRCRHR